MNERALTSLFARALLAVEPPKIEGGSPARRDWLGLVMTVQMYLHEHGHDVEAFRTALLDPAVMA